MAPLEFKIECVFTHPFQILKDTDFLIWKSIASHAHGVINYQYSANS